VFDGKLPDGVLPQFPIQAVNATKSELVAQPGTVTFLAAVALRPVTSLVGFRWIIDGTITRAR
jgi:hypothetical protein